MNNFVLILRLVLLPLSILYYIIIKSRNLLYDFGFVEQHSFKTPIISVGNITTGGTGKTPFVMHLVGYFLKQGKKVGVISRGYKSKTNELVIAHDGKGAAAEVTETGDELGMIVNRFSNVKDSFFAISYYDRIEAIIKMETLYSPDIILLDDAYQKRKIRKTVDIVLVNKERESFLDMMLIPAGNLREPLTSLKRADIVLKNYKFAEMVENENKSFNYINKGFFNLNNQRLEITKNIKVITVSGIADNSSFINAVKLSNVDIEKSFNFSDHFNYKASDIRNFESSWSENLIFLTTEKDFIKLKDFNEFIKKYPVYYLRIDVNLDMSSLEELFSIKHIL